MSYIVGISSYYHDSAACIIKDGSILAAAQEERFTRIKHDKSFPFHALRYCIEEAKINPEEIDFIVFHEKPFLKFERILETYLAYAPKGILQFMKALPVWAKEKLFQKKEILKELNSCFGEELNFNDKLLFSEHHLSHSASAFFPSPYADAAILTMDGVGEWTTSSISIGSGNNIKLLKEIHFPHSLGLLYSAFTGYLGFKVNSGEYKMMGLAPYGNPKYSDLIKDCLIEIKKDGSFFLNMEYFNYCTGLTMTSKKFHKLFKREPRIPKEKLDQFHMDIAASIQKVSEEIIIRICENIKAETKQENLCLAGGVALNCVINGILEKEDIFKNIWIQPASGDAGCSLGAAFAVHYMMLKNNRNIDTNDSMQGSYLGPDYDRDEIKSLLDQCNAHYKIFSEEILEDKVINYLDKGMVIGWMNGRMEFGPRALGNRSIIADPRSPVMQKKLNLKVKFRESFRPFAPSIIFEELKEWFNTEKPSPYMLKVSSVRADKRLIDKNKDKSFGIEELNKKRSVIPAVTHLDYSSRIQTVHSATNPKYHSLISRFYKLTGCPILVNTSFNIRGEPIVCSPIDAYKCFMSTNIDALVINNFLLLKKDQSDSIYINYKTQYELD